MSDYLHPNGYTYSIEEVEIAAANAGVDYDEFVKLRGFVPTNKTKTQLKLYNKRIKIDPESTPTFSAETMKLTEKKAKDKLIDKLGNLGYKVEERDDFFGGAQGIRIWKANAFYGQACSCCSRRSYRRSI